MTFSRLRSHKTALLFYPLIIVLALLGFDATKISTDLGWLFGKSRAMDILQTAGTFQSAHSVMMMSDGTDRQSCERIDAAAKKIAKIPGVVRLRYRQELPEEKMRAYLATQYWLHARFTPPPNSTEAIETLLQKKAQALMLHPFAKPFDRNDPLDLFTHSSVAAPFATTSDGHFRFGDHALGMIVQTSVDPADLEASGRLVSAIKEALAPYAEEMQAISAHFYSVQNSAKIKREVDLIIGATVVLMILLYLLILKDFRTFLLSTFALGMSMFAALSALTALFGQVSIFVLAFGSGISMMAIDYLLHLYFHGYYVEADALSRRRARSRVLLALGTTLLGFAVLTTVDFPLLVQLCMFAIISLSLSYLQFAWVFRSFRLVPNPERIVLRLPALERVDAKSLVILASLMLVLAVATLRPDTDLKRLDYDNQVLKARQALFEAAQPSQVSLFVTAKTSEALLVRLEACKTEARSLRSAADAAVSHHRYETLMAALQAVDFARLREQIRAAGSKAGFRTSALEDAYAFVGDLPKQYVLDEAMIEHLGYEIKPFEAGVATLAYANPEDAQTLSGKAGVVAANPSELLEVGLMQDLRRIAEAAAVALLVMTLLLVALLKKSAPLAVGIFLFPAALTLLVLALTTTLGVMHLFALLMILTGGVDYGVYLSRYERGTDEAIVAALFTSLTGFGIFLFSRIGALNQIGTVVVLGLLGVAAVLVLMKRGNGCR